MNIYKITNKMNNKSYVGLTTKSIETRFQGHKYAAINGGGYYLHAAMRKYGVEHFIIEKIDIANTIDELKEKEIKYILEYDTFNNGYNLTKGGDFTSNEGMVVVEDKTGNILQTTLLEFIERDDIVSVNKNKITIFKDDEKKRVSTIDYKMKYYDLRWRSKNYGYTTVILEDGTKTKIKSVEFDKDIHKGIQSGKQTYFNKELDKFESLTIDEINLDVHYSKGKCKYYVYNSNDKLVHTCLSKIPPIEYGGTQFTYLVNRNRNFNELILTKDVIDKLKFKNRNYEFLNYKLVKEQL